MTAFLAIVKLTWRSAWRSHIFRLLLGCLLLSVFVLPNTLISDGTLKGEIQLLLQYSLGFIFTILAISSVWLACSEISTDVETGLLHMLVVKPVTKRTILLAKTTGIFLIHLVLLLCSAIVIYIFVMAKVSETNLSGGKKYSDKKWSEEREIVQNQIFTARRKYSPIEMNFDEEAKQEFVARKELAKRNNQDISNYQTVDSANEMLNEIKRELIMQSMVVKPGSPIVWEYEGLGNGEKMDKGLYVRYTVYPLNGSTSEQDIYEGAWMFRTTYVREDNSGSQTVVNEVRAKEPEEIVTALQTEFMVPLHPEVIIHEGKAEIGYMNLDEYASLMFDKAHGPFLLVPASGFGDNFCRAILIMSIGLASLTMIAAACAAYLSLPIAIFFSAGYLFAGIIANFLLKTFAESPGTPLSAMDTYAKFAGNLTTLLLVPLQDFFITGKLATGELIEWSSIGVLALNDLCLRSLPLFLLGVWLYSTRELAIVVKR